VHLTFGAAQLADIDVDIADRRIGKPPALGRGLLAPWQSRDPMPRKAAMESTAGQLGDSLAQPAEDVIKRKQGAAAKLDDDCFLDLGQNRALR
jgi:hypothetical protein